jgi:hypothetical protein
MNRLNHVKIISTDPAAVERFLRLVAEVPAGWPLGDQARQLSSPAGPPLAEPTLTGDDVFALRGATSTNGYIVGDERSRQFQILRGEASRIWAIAIGTRDVARAHALCLEHGFEASPIDVTPWGNGRAVRFFFAKAGGVMFELMSVEKAG